MPLKTKQPSIYFITIYWYQKTNLILVDPHSFDNKYKIFKYNRVMTSEQILPEIGQQIVEYFIR
jgi:hypothetical protein